METQALTDLYQASYYLINGCQILNIECIPISGGTSCRIMVRGPDLATIEKKWFDRGAVVNLWAFRNAYSEINNHVQQAKRSFERSRRELESTGGAL